MILKNIFKQSQKTLLKKTIALIVVSLMFCVSLKAQEIKGKVTDENRDALIGVSVAVKNSTIGTVTDIDGNYTLNLGGNGAVLVFSYVGYERKEVEVKNQKVINITLLEDLKLLDEVVVIGFQSQKKVNLTGSVASVNSDVLENRPVANIGQALQGLVPNLNVSISNGGPNATPSFNIRGGTTMSRQSNGSFAVSSGSPLILLDGVEISETVLNQLNPNDIANMSIIKDASAAAIYGTKATFGVILVQTKSGQSKKASVSYSYDISFDKPAALPDILSSYDIQKSRMNVKKWTGKTVDPQDETLLAALDKFMKDPVAANSWYLDNMDNIVWAGNYNPYKQAVRNWAPTQKHNLSISGGTDHVNYYFSLAAHNQEGMYKVNTDQFSRYNFLMSVNAKLNKRLSFSAKTTYNMRKYTAPYLSGGKGNFWSAMRGEPEKNVFMPIKTSESDPVPNVWTDNIVGWLSYGANYKDINNVLMINLSPEYVILPEVLKIKADFAYTTTDNKYNRTIPRREYVTTNWNNLVSEQMDGKTNKANYRRGGKDFYTFNVYANFNKTFVGKHTLSGVFGFNQERTTFSSLEATYDNLLTSDLPGPGMSTDSKHSSQLSKYAVTGRAAFGRINYNFADRYLFEINGRYDGSSKFTKGDRFQFFPSFSLGWRISEESFVKDKVEWLNNLKIRGSWGRLGNQPGGVYPYQSTFGMGVAGYWIDGVWVRQVTAPGLVSPVLTWEKATTINGGLDVSLFSNRLSGTFDIYQRAVSDVLTDGSVSYPVVLGASAPLVNAGKLRTRGWELSLSWNDRLANSLQYGVTFTLSDYKMKVMKYDGNDAKKLGNIYSGARIGDIWGYVTDRIIQKEDFEEVDGKMVYTGPSQKELGMNEVYPGYVKYKDLDGSEDITPGDNTVMNPGDRKIIGNNTPRLRYGINGNLYYKGFDLNLFFQGLMKRDIYIGNSAFWGGGAGSQYMYDNSWTPERTSAKYPMYSASGSNTITQTKYLFNGAYLRLKQIVLGYTLPKHLTDKIGLNKVRFSISGYNVFEFTKIPSIYDPEQISDAYPQKRTIALGIQVTL